MNVIKFILSSMYIWNDHHGNRRMSTHAIIMSVCMNLLHREKSRGNYSYPAVDIFWQKSHISYCILHDNYEYITFRIKQFLIFEDNFCLILFSYLFQFMLTLYILIWKNYQYSLLQIKIRS